MLEDMENALEYQAAIHGATTVDEVAAILTRFFATLHAGDALGLPAAILLISTFSERGLLRKAHMARSASGAPAAPAAEKLLASAALKISVLEMDERAKGPWWRRTRA
jgi:hypothetical protein